MTGERQEGRLQVAVLGELRLRVDGVEAPFPPGRPGRLLAALLLAEGRVLSADQLVDLVWGEEPPEDARAALHTTVARVRRALGPAADVVGRRPPGYVLVEPVGTDAAAFRAAAAAARRSGDPAAFDEALAWWRGPAWAGLADDLARGEALRLEEERLELLEERAAALLGAGRVAEAVGELRLLTAAEPLRERPVGLMMRALHAAGDVAEALRVYDEHRTVLAEELGLDPSRQLQEVHRQVLDRSVEAPVAPPDRGRAEIPAVPLIGREAHLAAIRDLLRHRRCVTVVGPGGVGKTSVAAAVALDEPGPAVWWVDLARVPEERGVRPAVADAVGASAYPGATLDDALRGRLAPAAGLLVLDNCEHLLAACADLVDDVVRWRSDVRVLATSRERLGAVDEQVFPLPPLRLPAAPGGAATGEDAARLAGSPAVQLFLARAAAANPEFCVDGATLPEVAALVRDLDGLPLAIELAAGRLGSVTLDDLRSRLAERLDLLRSGSRRAPARHRTLRAAVEWSHDLLDPEQQRVLRGLSVFAGPFDLGAAEAVLGSGSATVVADLVDRSLVVGPGVSGRGRYRLLETLRAFARARLDASGEAPLVHRAHASWAVEVARRAADGLAGPDEVRWAAEVDAALPDLEAAVRWSLHAGDPGAAAAIVASVQPWAYYHVRPDVLGWALPLLDAELPGPLVAGVRLAASGHCWMAGRFGAARGHAQAGLAATGGSAGPESARCLGALGDLQLAVGEVDGAAASYAEGSRLGQQAGLGAEAAINACGVVLARTYAGGPFGEELAAALRLAGAVDNPTTQAFALYTEGEALSDLDPEIALDRLEGAVRGARAAGNVLLEGVALTARTAVTARSGRLDAETLGRTAAAVRHWVGSGNENLFVTCLRNVVPLLARLAEHRAVVELVAALDRAAPDRPSYGGEAERIAACVAQARAELGDAFEGAWAAGRRRSAAEAAEAVLALLARLARTPAGLVEPRT